MAKKSTAAAPALTFAGMKLETGICVINGKLTYGGRLTGVVTEADKSAFSILSTEKEDTTDIKVDTFLVIDPANPTKEIMEVNEDLTWFFNASDTPKIPSEISADIKKIVLKDVNRWKNMYKKSAFHPIGAHPEEVTSVIIKTLIDTGKYEELSTFYTQLMEELKRIKKANSAVGLEAFVNRYAFREHILLSGPAGSSKTFTADAYLTSEGCAKEFVAGHEGLESTDLLGYPIRDESGNFVWMDGPLTAAFRTAQTEKVGLFIDELLRIPSKELNILIGALTPNSSKQFVLRTNRLIDVAEGVGKSETLTIPMENLWVVATTNVGANYNVEDMDLALNDRFITHDVTVKAEIVREILTVSNPHSHEDSMIDKLMKLFDAVNGLVTANELTHNINVRHLTKIMKNVKDPVEIKSYLFDLAPNICSRTTAGSLNESELQIFKDTIKALF